MTEGLAVPSHSSESAPEPPLSSVGEALTFRAVFCAIILGSVVCFANTYFGLQAGTVNAMPMQTSLLAFALFRSIQHRISKSLSPEETTVIEIIAGALGLAPFTSGFTGPIPALEFLTTPVENGPKRFSAAQLIQWSIATCALGTVLAVPFRRLFILRECLRYPSATATGTLIGVLFGKETIVARAQQFGPPEYHPLVADTDSDLPEAASEDRTSDHLNTNSPHEVAVNVLIMSFSGSALFSLISYFIPILKNMPIFGRTLAKDWLWAFNLSPAYFGYGIIIGPSINLYTLLGAIVGWGILSPIAKHNGWAVGPVDDWDNGSRGWILWVGIGLILGDSAVGLVWVISKPLMSWAQRQRLERLGSQVLGEQERLLQDSDNKIDSAVDDDWPATSRVTLSLILWTGVILLLLYFVSLLSIFRGLVSPFATMIAVVLVPFGAFMSMRSLGETDNGASLAIGTSIPAAKSESAVIRNSHSEAGRAAQCIIGLLVPASDSNHIFSNLLLGCVVEAGASQASQQIGGLKTAYMTRTPPIAIFYSQIIGSFAGALIATLVYKIYTSVNEIPNEEFGIPEAHMWIVAARLIYQQGLPPRALDFAVGAFLIGAVFSILRILGSNHWWRGFVPSSVAIAIGMYLVPAITLPRALGSVILIIGHNRFGIENFVLMCSATGLILGQGVFGLVALAFDALHLPHL